MANCPDCGAEIPFTQGLCSDCEVAREISRARAQKKLGGANSDAVSDATGGDSSGERAAASSEPHVAEVSKKPVSRAEPKPDSLGGDSLDSLHDADALRRIAIGKARVAERKKLHEEYGIYGHVITIAIVLIAVAFFWSFFGGSDSKETSGPETRTERIERCFSGWDGSHQQVVRVIKAGMNDPDSFEHVETRYWDNGSSLTVTTTFRGRNAFGGIVTNSVTMITGLDCSVIDVVAN